MLRRVFLSALFGFVALASGVSAGAGQGKGEDLPVDAPLRVGVKYRPEDCERKTKKGDSLSMHYTGTLYKDGSKFDSSHDRNQPFSFTLGQGMVIKGWDEGLTGMCVGEKRKLTIPAGKGYGASGAGAKIPGGATLVFDVELLEIKGAGGAQDL